MENKTGNTNTKILTGYIFDDVELENLNNCLENKKEFDQYIIAYIDFLGMKEKMQKESFETLKMIEFIVTGIRKVAEMIKSMNKLDEFKVRIFSDNVLIALKLNETDLKNQLISVINLLTLIQFTAFTPFNIMVRGAVTVGELFISNEIVWGKGLIDAYLLENEVAVYPRIILSKGLLKTYNANKSKGLNLYALIQEDFDGYWYLDFFSAVPSITNIPIFNTILTNQAISYASAPHRIKQKFNWTLSYFNHFCLRYKNRGGYDKYIIPLLD